MKSNTKKYFYMRFRTAVPVLLALFMAAFTCVPGSAFCRDIYEDDDSFETAGVIPVSIETADEQTLQNHTFHDAGDQDWVQFYGLSGLTYQVRVTDVGAKNDIVIELFDTDGTTLLASRDDYREGEGETLDWSCPADGKYFVRLTNYAADIFGDDTEYVLNVNRPVGPAGVGVVTGTATGSETGEPLPQVVVTTSGGGSALSDDAGIYYMPHVAGTFSLIATKEDFLAYSDEITVEAGALTTKDILLSCGTTTTSTCPPMKLYGVESEEVLMLREFRDTVLCEFSGGRKVISLYYKLCPLVSRLTDESPVLQKILKDNLDAFLPLIEASLAE